MKYLRLFLILLLLISTPFVAIASDDNCGDADATTWCFDQEDGITLDGNSFCGGACEGGDDITIMAARVGAFTIDNMVGSDGNPIVIHNPTDAKVTITGGGSSTVNPYCIRIDDSQYVKLSGASYGSETYGFRLYNGYRGIWIYESSDIEVENIEIDTTHLMGINIMDMAWTSANTFQDMQIHDNFIHHTGTEGMYLGHSTPAGDFPQFDNLDVYDNLVEDSGTDGIQIGQVKGTGSTCTGNIVRRSHTIESEVFHWHGIVLTREVSNLTISNNIVNGVKDIASGEYAGVGGIGIYLEVDSSGIVVENNVVIDAEGEGIRDFNSGESNTIRNNTFISSGDYGILTDSDTTNIHYNLLVECSIGCNSSVVGGNDCDETNNNRTSASIAGEYFAGAGNENYSLTYQSPAINDSDDSAGYSTTDYNGDTRPYGSSDPDPGAYEFTFKAADVSPPDDSTGNSTTVDLTWQNPETTTGVYVYFDKTTNPPTTEVVSGGLVETYDPGTLDDVGEYFFKINLVHPDGTETGDVYYFTTTEGPPAPPAGLAVGVYHSLGMTGVYDDQGATVVRE